MGVLSKELTAKKRKEGLMLLKTDMLTEPILVLEQLHARGIRVMVC